jgi:Metallo-beta-lactamase superfamily
MPLAFLSHFAKLPSMNFAPDLVRISRGLFSWFAYDPAVKADLFSSAVITPAGCYLVDPIQLSDIDTATVAGEATPVGVVVTNANHHRAALHYSDKFSVPVSAHQGSFPDQAPLRFVELADGAKIGGSLEVIKIDGAVAGEIALYDCANGGTFFIGDALINFDPYGFTFLPRKYCQNEKEMRRSLRKLLAFEAERMLFAHGTPILTAASDRLRELINARRGGPK